MLLRVAHSSAYRYDPPATAAIQVLRLTPRNHDGQYVVDWRIDVTPDARLSAREDAFGNITHVFTAAGPLAELRVEVEGRVETQNTDGVVRGTVERFPPSLFLRDTVLTQADAAIRELAAAVRAGSGGQTLAELHALLDRLHDDLGIDGEDAAEPGPAAAIPTAAEAFARQRASTRDLSHIFISAAHSLGIPARYVGGYCRCGDADAGQQTSHAWAEAFVPDLGWVGFDPANGVCPSDAHVRIAVGLDALGAAPLRGTRLGAGAETVAVAIRVDQ